MVPTTSMATSTYISTRSTLMPHGSVASSNAAWNIDLQEQREKAEKDVDKSKHLHIRGYALSVAEDLVQVFCPQDVSQSGLRQQPGMVFIFFFVLFLSHSLLFVFLKEIWWHQKVWTVKMMLNCFLAPRGMMSIFNVGHTHGSVGNPEFCFQFEDLELVFLIGED